jgi:hypothetical protein
MHYELISFHSTPFSARMVVIVGYKAYSKTGGSGGCFVISH